MLKVALSNAWVSIECAVIGGLLLSIFGWFRVRWVGWWVGLWIPWVWLIAEKLPGGIIGADFTVGLFE
jgi:hypothetical protein